MRPVEVRQWNPLRTFQFHILLDGEEVAGVRSASGLSWSTSSYEVWEGGNNLHRYANPERVTWEPLTLEQGLAIDDRFERWAQACLDHAAGRVVDPAEPVKRIVEIEVYDFHSYKFRPSRGLRARKYTVHNAWVSRYDALPKLDAMASEVAIVSVELTHEGFVIEPHDPSEGITPGFEL